MTSSVARSPRLRRLAPAILIATAAFGSAAGVSMEAAGVASAQMTNQQLEAMCAGLGGEWLEGGLGPPGDEAHGWGSCCWYAEDTGKTHCNNYYGGELISQSRKAATGLDPAVPVTSAPRPPLRHVPSDIGTMTLTPTT